MLQMKLYGGSGKQPPNAASPDAGKGGYISCTYFVPSSLTVLYVFVGGSGGGQNGQNVGGWNGGGYGSVQGGQIGGGGGGASDVRLSSSMRAFETRICTAAGGGGGVSLNYPGGGAHGGGLVGESSYGGSPGAQGGTNNAGGAASGIGGLPGVLGFGGNGSCIDWRCDRGGGGGGGGFFGGGGGGSWGGAGGSSNVGNGATLERTLSGVRSGNGNITIVATFG